MTWSQRSLTVRVLLVCALLIVVPKALYAQVDTGVIDGRALDENKNPVAGVTVTAKNVATGLTRTAVSGDTGTYRLEFLPSGTYDVTAQGKNWATVTQKAAIVQIGTSTTVDFQMKVAAVSELVTVTGDTPLVQTTRSDVGQVITSSMVENIPLNGRKFQDLSLLVPGTRPSNYYDPTKTEVGGISYGGMTGRAVNITVDGADNNDGVVRGLLQQFSADAIKEYKVTTSRYSAEHGRSTGGVVNVVTKSGTNTFDGSAFLFARDDSLNAKTFFEKSQGLEKQPFEQEQFGGTAGGPIKRDRAFFFGSYEFNRRQDFATVETGGILPDEEGPQLKPFRNHLLTLKSDFRLPNGDAMLVRYTREDNKREHDFIGAEVLKNGGALNTNVIDSVIGKHTKVFGGNKVNEFLVLFQNFENNITADDNRNPQVIAPDFTFGANINTPQQTIQRRWQFKDDFAFRKSMWGGDHDLKAGVEIVKSHYGGFFIPTLYGAFYFSQPLAGGLDAYLNSIADTFTGSAGNNEADDNWTSVGIYFQDDFHPTNRLTLNLGLRYELQSGPYSNDFQTPVLASLGQLGYNNQRSLDTNNLGPRLGFAWDVGGDAKTIIRGGYGIYYDEIFQNITLYERWTDVRTPLNFLTFSPTPWTPAFYAANRQSIRDSFIDPTFQGQIMRLTSPDLVQPWAHHFNVGGSRQITPGLAIDVDYVHSVGKDEIHRWPINRVENLNTDLSPAGRFLPQFNEIRVEGNRGHSQYDGLYFTGRMRMSKAQLLASYAWTEANNIADDFGSNPSNLDNLHWEDDWGPAPNDVRHRFTAGVVGTVWGNLHMASSIQANTGKPFEARTGQGGSRNRIRAIDPSTGQPFPRNSFRAGNFFSWDMRFSYLIRMQKTVIEPLFEIFNITNYTNYDRDSYVTTFSSPRFGTPGAIINNSQRQAQFGVRVKF